MYAYTYVEICRLSINIKYIILICACVYGHLYI